MRFKPNLKKIKNPFGQKGKKALRFLEEVILEMKRIQWLSLPEAIKHTILVIIVSVVIATFLGGLDFLFARILEILILS